MSDYPFPSDGPSIDLAFYWHNEDEPGNMRRLLCWLQQLGYEIDGEVIGLRLNDGCLPRYPGMYYANLPDEVVLKADDPSLKETLEQQSWVVADARLTTASIELAPLELGFGLIGRESYDQGEAHPIAMRISAQYHEHWLDGESMTPEMTAQTARAESARARLFRGVCDDLQPDYASDRLEDDGFYAPTSLLASERPDHYDRLYVADKVVAASEFRGALVDNPK